MDSIARWGVKFTRGRNYKLKKHIEMEEEVIAEREASVKNNLEDDTWDYKDLDDNFSVGDITMINTKN